MKKQVKSGLWNSTFGEIGATLKFLEDQGLSLEEMALLRSDKVLIQEVVKLIKSRTKIENSDILVVWHKIYREWFGANVDISELQVPDTYNPEKHFLVLVAKGVTMNAVVTAMRKIFKVYLYTEDLGVGVTKNDRTTDGTYFVLFNRNIEADEEFKNMSADNLTKKGYQGITLLERLLLEVLYFSETKKHLDINNWTLCSGSRFSEGGVPCVCWLSGGDGLSVSWCSSDCSRGDLRSRVVVS
ncbi:MAG TPA: hypothetical protein PK686_03985 [bacterium]|nr:hypothetical protein [bacterium]HPV65803.1 hypothetical protein [bacterium]